MSTFFENTRKLIEKAAQMSKISGDVLARLEEPQNILEFDILVGDRKFPAWRVQHNNALGPYKGGVRYHPDSNLDEVKALASLMTWKTSLMGLPYGGGKGAIKVDPRKLNIQELEELSRGYVRKIWQHIGPQKDVPAPDVGTNAQILDWMTDEYAKLVGHWEPAAFTGKSVDKGGSQGREVATGFGGYVVLREFLNLQPTRLPSALPQANGGQATYNLQPVTVAIQGFGNVGSNIAKILYEHGFKIVAISDSKGALYEEEGIDITKVSEVKEKTGTIERTRCYAASPHNEPCRQATNAELLELPVDILIPAALENVVTQDNAGKIKAKVILEMANGPTTPEAEKILAARGVEVLPDILANGGGVAGSYFEWLQSLDRKYWDEAEVLQKIDEKLTEAFAAVAKVKKEYKSTWRQAAYIRAVRRVAEAIKK